MFVLFTMGDSIVAANSLLLLDQEQQAPDKLSGVWVKLSEDEKDNAKCEDCGCQFEFNPDIEIPALDS